MNSGKIICKKLNNKALEPYRESNTPLVKENRRGQTLVEFSLVLPLLLMLIFGIVEFGRIYSAKLTLDHAVSVGGKEAAFARTPAYIAEKSIQACTGIPVTVDDVTVAYYDENDADVTGTATVDDYMIFDTAGSVYAKVSMEYMFEPIVPFPQIVEQGELLKLSAEAYVKVQ